MNLCNKINAENMQAKGQFINLTGRERPSKIIKDQKLYAFDNPNLFHTN